jgi:hypothetical protein
VTWAVYTCHSRLKSASKVNFGVRVWGGRTGVVVVVARERD